MPIHIFYFGVLLLSLATKGDVPTWAAVTLGYLGFLFGRLLLVAQLRAEGFKVEFNLEKRLGEGKYKVRDVRIFTR